MEGGPVRQVWLLSADGLAQTQADFLAAEYILPNIHETVQTVLSNHRQVKLDRGLMVEVDMRGDVLRKIMEFVEMVLVISRRGIWTAAAAGWKERYLGSIDNELLKHIFQEVARRNKMTGELSTNANMEMLERWLQLEGLKPERIPKRRHVCGCPVPWLFERFMGSTHSPK